MAVWIRRRSEMVMVLACLAGAVSAVCEKRSSCSCQSDKGLIDLSPLDSQTGQPHFGNVPDPETLHVDLYYFNPCTPFTMIGGMGCQNVAVCQGYPKPTPTSYMSYGRHDGATFDSNATTQQLVLRYDVDNKHTIIELVCDHSLEGKLSVVQADSFSNLKMRLESKYCCTGGSGSGAGVSVGTILCILFIVVVVLYLTVGILYMHHVKHAEGRHKIPNYEFWVSLHGLNKAIPDWLNKADGSSMDKERKAQLLADYPPIYSIHVPS